MNNNSLEGSLQFTTKEKEDIRDSIIVEKLAKRKRKENNEERSNKKVKATDLETKRSALKVLDSKLIEFNIVQGSKARREGILERNLYNLNLENPLIEREIDIKPIYNIKKGGFINKVKKLERYLTSNNISTKTFRKWVLPKVFDFELSARIKERRERVEGGKPFIQHLTHLKKLFNCTSSSTSLSIFICSYAAYKLKELTNTQSHKDLGEHLKECYLDYLIKSYTGRLAHHFHIPGEYRELAEIKRDIKAWQVLKDAKKSLENNLVVSVKSTEETFCN